MTSYVAYQLASVLVTLNDCEGHFLTSVPWNYKVFTCELEITHGL